MSSIAPDIAVKDAPTTSTNGPLSNGAAKSASSSPMSSRRNSADNSVASVNGVTKPESGDEDFDYIDSVEWGPRKDESGYDTDQDLVPRPRQERQYDPCMCSDPGDGSLCCLDQSCLTFACQEECRTNCPAGDACGNKRLQRRQYKPVQVFDAGPKGRGLRTLEDLEKGDLIIEYTGRAVKASKLERLFRRYQLDRRLYIMALGDGVYIDARHKGGVARYINHSCEPNCRVERWKVRGILRAAVVAIAPVKAGEELTFDYQWVRKRGRAPTKCYCGTASCRGTLEVSKSLEETAFEKELQRHWERHSSEPDHTIVNRSVQVYSAEHEAYFLGEITGFDDETGKHLILYRHDMLEEWVDLTKEDWMILNAQVDKDHFVIAKKRSARRPSPTISLLAAAEKTAGGAPLTGKNYIYVQTPIKEAFWSKHLVERCERTCTVQIHAEQFARPPLGPNPDDAEEVEKFEALDRTLDGTVWKLTITGTEVSKALSILEKNVAYVEKRLESEAIVAAARQAIASSAPARPALQANSDLTGEHTHEIVIPREIVDAVKRDMAQLRGKCNNRGVTINFAASESKSEQFSKLLLEGTLLSDIQWVKEQLWHSLVTLCEEYKVPFGHSKIHRNLGFLGGALSAEQFRLLNNDGKTIGDGGRRRRLTGSAQEDLQRSPFVTSFETTYRCSVWVQSVEDQGRISSSNKVVAQADSDSPRKVFFGCDPRDIQRLWALVHMRASELARGVHYLYLGRDRVFQKLMMEDGGQFFRFVEQVTSATVTVDNMTGDHLRIDGRRQQNGIAIDLVSEVAALDEAQRASLAEEIIRLQIELFRDHCTREQGWLFGRDWTLAANSSTQSTAELTAEGASTKSLSFGHLDAKTAGQAAFEIAEIVGRLDVPDVVAVHAAIILYRFVSLVGDTETQVKPREAVLACIFMANKSQKAVKWKKLEAVLEAGYETFYPGTKFEKEKEEVAVLEERVIGAEKEILKILDFDVFACDIEWILEAATKAWHMKNELVEKVLDFAFSGTVLSAGPELWLKYGVEYIFAVAAAFLKMKLDDLLAAMGLIPLKVSQAAEVLIESAAKFDKSHDRKGRSHKLLDAGRDQLRKSLPRIKESCVECMKKLTINGPSGQTSAMSVAAQRNLFIAKRNRSTRIIRGVSSQVVKDHVLTVVDGVAAESSCSIFIASANPDAEDIILEGPWRAIAVAERLLRTKVAAALPPSIDESTEPRSASKIPAKVEPGLVRASDVQTSQGWDGTIQAQVSSVSLKGRKIGGKSCIAGRVSESSLRRSGLRWWIPSKDRRSPTGALKDMFLIRTETTNIYRALSEVARSLVGTSADFPTLTSFTDSQQVAHDRFTAISLQQWPSEKVAAKETEKTEKYKGKSMQMGFSAAALQEMQLLTQLHGLVASPYGHPNFLLPVGLVMSADGSNGSGGSPSAKRSTEENDPIASLFASSNGGKADASDPMFSLFRSSKENEKVAQKDKKVKACPHIVFHPTPLVLHRFLSKKKHDDVRTHMAVLESWFYDLLSALVHCHSNHVIMRTIQADQIVVDHNGTAKFGGLYRSTVLGPDERKDKINLVKAARKSDKGSGKSGKKKKGDDDDEDYSNNPFVAPEILLGSPKHTKESDVWAMGCLLAYLLLGKPLFQEKDRKTLLTAHYKVVGTPAKKNFEDAARFPQYSKPDKKYGRGVERAFEHKLKDESKKYAKAIDLIAGMLHLDPRERITAEEALNHVMMVEYLEKCQSEGFQQQYVDQWMRMKDQSMRSSGSTDDETKRELKRKQAMLLAATKTDGGDDDDLYDMDDILGDDPASKKPKL